MVSLILMVVTSFLPYPFEREALHELWLRGNLRDPFFDYLPMPDRVLSKSLSSGEDKWGNLILERLPYLVERREWFNFSVYTFAFWDTVWNYSFFFFF